MRKAITVSLLFLAACRVGPEYERPQICMPDAYHELTGQRLSNQTESLVSWWEQFEDDQLNQLIHCALENAPDMEIARQRVREARAARCSAAGVLYPRLGAGGGARSQRESANALIGGVPQDIRFLTFDSFDVGFDASWELDIFGQNRRLVEEADAELQAQCANAGDIIISLLAEVARNYAELRGFQNRIVVARENLQSQGDVVQLIEARFDAGLVSELDLAEARTLYAATESTIPLLEEGRYAALHRISVLLGLDPDWLLCELEEIKPIPGLPSAIPVGTPCEIICRRPDVRRAEWEMVAANANIGVQVAELFPKVDLLGALGMAAFAPHLLTQRGSRTWLFGARIFAPLFEGGRLRANIEEADAAFHVLLAEYQKTVLEALEDVRNAMVGFEMEQERVILLKEAVKASKRSVELARDLYSHGLDDFLRVLIAERALDELQDDLVASQAATVEHAIALYKALGGGWYDC